GRGDAEGRGAHRSGPGEAARDSAGDGLPGRVPAGRTARSAGDGMTRSGAALQLPLELDSGSSPIESDIPAGTAGLHAVSAEEERVRQEVARGGARFDRVLFTRNRRVMASAADRGRTLRLHEVFRQAPADVLRALGENF